MSRPRRQRDADDGGGRGRRGRARKGPPVVTLRGTVLSLRSRHALVRLEGEPVRCRLGSALFREKGPFTHPLAVGDEVTVQKAKRADPVVTTVHPRQSQLVRWRLRARRQQVVIANLDLVAVVVSVMDPPLHPRLIDRVIVAAERERLDVLIVINKADLIEGLDEEAREDVEDAIALYEALRYEVRLVSASNDEGIAELRDFLRDKTTVFCGHSGVGKSSLLNRLQPGLSLQTGEVSEHWGRGRHTTTTTQLVELEGGGLVADTPGVRAFAIGGMEPWEIALCFRELAIYGRECHFTPCSHDHEPECAVKTALQAGEIPIGRYESYLRIIHDADVHLGDGEFEDEDEDAVEDEVEAAEEAAPTPPATEPAAGPQVEIDEPKTVAGGYLEVELPANLREGEGTAGLEPGILMPPLPPEERA